MTSFAATTQTPPVRTNRYPATCGICRKDVAPDQGAYLRVDDRAVVLCATCAGPRMPRNARIGVSLSPCGALVYFQPTGWLGSNFQSYRDAMSGSATYRKETKRSEAPLGQLAMLSERLRLAGFDLEVHPDVVAAAQAFDAQGAKHVEVAQGHARAADAILRASGRSLMAFQAEGVAWLASMSGAILADEMGCVDGEAVVHVNRAGKGFSLTLAELYHRFRGEAPPSGRRWDLSIPTKIRSLCDGELRQHDVRAVLDKGSRPVLRVTLASGKYVRLTPDHEIATADGGWCAAERLSPGDRVVTNGQFVPAIGASACLECGSKDDLITYPLAKFRNYCRTCMYRVCRGKPTWSGGKSLSSDGYVRISGQWNHPRRDSHGQVLEHHLVMESMIGRCVSDDEEVHHKNGVRDDNRPENLELMTKSGHMAHHGRDGGYRHLDGSVGGRGGQVMFVPKFDSVVDVCSDGDAHVYDVVCADPHRNFVANGVVVHNCGKTIQALLAAPTSAGMVVVCPKVAKGVWSREASRWRPDLTVTLLAGRGSFRWPLPGELVVTNYELLPSEASCPGVVHTCPAGVTLVADEGHMLKAGAGKNGSQRSRSFKALSEAVRDRGGRAWIVTGSPQLNDRYHELRTLLALVGQAGNVFGSYEQFLALCGGVPGRFGGIEWNPRKVDPSVPQRLRRALLRRRKADVLPQLPEKIVEVIDVAIDRPTMIALEKQFKELSAAGVDVLAAIDDAKRHDGKVRFHRFSQVREILARAKTAHALEMIEELEEAGEPVVVGSAHRGPIDALGARPGWAAITGDASDAERQRIADAFQAGKLRGIAGTIQAMGVAITLTRASEAIVIDPMTVPELNRQFEDRIHRIGQGRTARIRYLRADHAVDHAVFDACDLKDEFVRRTVHAATVTQAPAPVLDTEAALVQARGEEPIQDGEEDPAQLEALLAQIRSARASGDIAKLRQRSLQKAAAAVVSRGFAISALRPKSPARGPENPAEQWAAASLVYLASLCDGATALDGVGFMKSDIGLGHALAASVAHGLSDLEWTVAVLICQRYPRQVGRPGDAPAETEA